MGYATVLLVVMAALGAGEDAESPQARAQRLRAENRRMRAQVKQLKEANAALQAAVDELGKKIEARLAAAKAAKAPDKPGPKDPANSAPKPPGDKANIANAGAEMLKAIAEAVPSELYPPGPESPKEAGARRARATKWLRANARGRSCTMQMQVKSVTIGSARRLPRTVEIVFRGAKGSLTSDGKARQWECTSIAAKFQTRLIGEFVKIKPGYKVTFSGTVSDGEAQLRPFFGNVGMLWFRLTMKRCKLIKVTRGRWRAPRRR